MKSLKIRTSVHIGRTNHEWAKTNIRNLSVFLDEKLWEERTKILEEGYRPIYLCKCGHKTSYVELMSNQSKCRGCGQSVLRKALNSGSVGCVGYER